MKDVPMLRTKPQHIFWLASNPLRLPEFLRAETPQTSASSSVSTTPAVKPPENRRSFRRRSKAASVTFRLKAPKALKVSLRIEGIKDLTPMTKNDEGIWSITLDPMKPEIYEYSFSVDGFMTIDPANGWIKESMRPGNACMFEIEGDELCPWNAEDVPHGGVTMHTFRSKALNPWRTFRVYTPPDYMSETRRKRIPCSISCTAPATGTAVGSPSAGRI